MTYRSTMSRSVVALSLTLAVVAASCSDDDGGDGGDGGAEPADVVESTPVEPDGGDDDGGVAATGSLAVTGALEDSLDEAADTVAFRAGGGCAQGTFAMSVKVDVDGRTLYDVIVPELAGVDGSTTGAFTTEVEVHYYDPAADAFEAEEFVGEGTVTILEQRPDERAFEYEVTGTFESEDDPARSVDVDFDYTAPIICS
ncbi:MAG TPA: hypothetical protein VK860_15850 [Ilumatobacteraceae bacterium]|nr:hypothetical protein [Ilumatobacteraceae bacterium]